VLWHAEADKNPLHLNTHHNGKTGLPASLIQDKYMFQLLVACPSHLSQRHHFISRTGDYSGLVFFANSQWLKCWHPIIHKFDKINFVTALHQWLNCSPLT